MLIIDAWMRDIPQQFLGRRNIEVLIKAFARQMQELQQAFDDMKAKLDLDTATGQNLDYVGTIIPLSRKEAGELAGINVTDPVISDGRYRQYLRYQNLVNTNECTYYDLMEGISLLWENHPAIHYVERQERPATIFLEMQPFSLDDEDPARERTLAIKPAGVGLIYSVWYEGIICNKNLERFILRSVHFKTGIPFWGCCVLDGTWRLDGSVLLGEMRRYGLSLSIWNGYGIGDKAGDARLHALSTRWEQNTQGGVAARMAFRFVADFWRTLYLDGGFLLDGGYLLNASRHMARMALALRSEVDMSGQEMVANVTVETKTRDYWFLDGALPLDGGRKLNSIYRKEAVE